MLKKLIHKNLGGVPIHTWLLLCVICLVGYWPVSANLFSLKNDAYIYFLPCRFFISECIQTGHLPLWNPYFYMGFPLHGDMQGGAWNPIVLFISLFGRYNMTTLQYETLLYIFIAAIGMYKLVSVTPATHLTKLVVAVAYMFCGFIINTGQITVWTGSAAFIPFVFLYYYRVLYDTDNIYKNALKTAVALYFLLTAGYPSFVIMCLYMLFFMLVVCCISKTRQNNFNKNYLFRLIKANMIIAIAFLLIALPALLSYIDYLPYYQRSTGATLREAQVNPFNPFAVISYLFPLSVTRDHAYLHTDPTAKSAYIGLFTFIFLAGVFRRRLTGLQKFILAATIFTFLFSLGDALPVREFCYNYLPLMNLFRHPGTMRIFTTIGLLVLSSFYLEDFFQVLKNRQLKFYKLTLIVAAFFVATVIAVYVTDSSLPEKITSFITSYAQPGNIRAFLKDFYAGFSFADAILLEGIIQLLFLLSVLFLTRKSTVPRLKWLAAIFIINPVLLAQFSIPSTFVTQQSPIKINQLIAASPATYPIPELSVPVEANNAIEQTTNREYGHASFYTKKIVQAKDELNPSFTRSLQSFDSAYAVSSIVLKYPVCYFADSLVHYRDSSKVTVADKKILFVNDTAALPAIEDGVEKDAIQITKFAPWGLTFITSTTVTKPFVLFQNYNKNWKLEIDVKNAVIKKGNLSFMYAEIEKGEHVLEFKYRPPYIVYSVIISLLTCLAIIFLLLKHKKRRSQ